MSVINIMLRELDQRQGRVPGTAAATGAVRSVSPPSPWHLGKAARVLIGLILAGGAVGAWWIQRQAGAAVAATAVSAPVPAVAAAGKTAAAAGVTAAPAAAATPPAPAAALAAAAAAVPAPVPNPAAAATVAALAAAPAAVPAAKTAPASPAPAPLAGKAERETLTMAAIPKVAPAAAPVAPAKPAAAAAVPAAALAGPPTVVATAVARSDPGAGLMPRVLSPGLPGEGKVYTPKQAAAKQVADAAALIRQGRNDEARALLQRTLDSQPAEMQARQMLVQLHLESGQLDPAQALLIEGQRLHPDQPGFAQTLARVKVEKGDVPGAIQLLEASSRGAGRDDPQTHALLGALLLRVLRYEESVQHYLVALRTDPGNTSWLVGAGVGLEATGKTSDAAEAYRRAASAPGLTPDLAGFLNDRLVRLGAARP
jgi:MSHA biogenesis protein MshN